MKVIENEFPKFEKIFFNYRSKSNVSKAFISNRHNTE